MSSFALIVATYVHIYLCTYITKYNVLNLYVTFMCVFLSYSLLYSQLVGMFFPKTISPILSTP